jgi:4a-hydroxytetrahydrobiopterin dehydratase
MTVLSDHEIEQRVSSDWRYRRSDGGAIVREWKLEDFPAAIAFVNLVAEAAEQAGHHPDILVHGWNRVRLELSTHSEGGVTEADLALAARLDQLA